MSICILSNVNVGTLSILVEKYVENKVRISQGYNTWIQDLIESNFLEIKPEAIFIILDGRELIGEKLHSDWNTISQFLNYFLGTINNFIEKHSDIPVFVSSLDILQETFLPSTYPRIEYKLEAYWRSELEKMAVPILEIAEIARNMGREKFYSKSMWYLGSIPFSRVGERAIAEEILNSCFALNGKRKKCLVLDLDNTLWGGVIGEDGMNGIELATTKEGSRFRDFQRGIKDLKNTGVLLTIVSKNNEEDALLPIRKHPDMLLKEEDFVIIKANWKPKAVNIKDIAEELNIGIDSLVFIDDNPVERAAVRSALPDVVVPDFPEDTALLEHFILDISKKYFPILKLTKEDLDKTAQYKIEQQREEIKLKSFSVEDYLKTLEMKKTFRQVNDSDITRAAQLTQKTNQFNLTTKRYTESDIIKMVNSDEYQVWIGELEDKFGSYGKIILAIIKLKDTFAEIDTFLMSCRVMGRKIEKDFLDKIEKELSQKGINILRSEYIPTPKNSVVKDFWVQQGYKLLDSDMSRTIFTKKI